MDELLAKYSEDYGTDATRLRNLSAKAQLQSERMREELVQRVAEQTPVLLAAIGQREKASDQRYQALESLRDHWWVQVEVEDEWRDFDPLAPEGKPGIATKPAESTNEPAELEQELFQQIEVVVIVEQWAEGELKEHPALTHTLRPSDLLGQRIELAHLPMNWPQDLNLLENPKDATSSLKEAVLGQTEWLPVLRIGRDVVSQASFDDKGEINNEPNLQPAEKVGKEVRGIFGGALGTLAGERKKERQANTQLTAEWFEYRIQVPGQPVRVVRRQVFDLVGPAARKKGNVPPPAVVDAARSHRAIALLDQFTLLPLVCQLSPAFVSQLTADSLLANRAILLEVLGGEKEPTAETAKQAMNRMAETVVPLPGPEYSLALMRGAWAGVSKDIYLNRPNILVYRTGIRLSQQEAAWNGYAQVDIVENGVGVHLRAQSDPFLLRLQQGILDTNAETLVLPLSDRSISGASELMSGAALRKANWLAIRKPPDDLQWAKIGAAPDARGRIESDLASGNIVCLPLDANVPQAHGLNAWWRVDPATGQALGMSDDGAGAAQLEYIIIESASAAVMLIQCLVKVSGAHSSDATLVATFGCLIAAEGVGFGVQLLLAGAPLPGLIVLLESEMLDALAEIIIKLSERHKI